MTTPSAEIPPARPGRVLRVNRGAEFSLPLFIPVFRPGFALTTLSAWEGEPRIRGCIVNAFFLYKDRAIRDRFDAGLTLAEYVGFDGLLCTDSGAFQGFRRPLYLANKDIVPFQDRIRTDIAAPLDLITPPGDSRAEAERKLATTQKRVREALGLVEYAILAGIQQGGRYLDLRRRSAEELVQMGVRYLGIGSLVPFLNRNHNLAVVGEVIRSAREVAGPDLPMHVYGAGDPVEIPFMVRLGADIFDSSSYSHFAGSGWYMTPYGALRDPGPLLAGEYRCPCPVCASVESVEAVFADLDRLIVHNLWTIHHVLQQVREALAADRLDARLEEILEVHARWFPDSALPSTWRALHE